MQHDHVYVHLLPLSVPRVEPFAACAPRPVVSRTMHMCPAGRRRLWPAGDANAMPAVHACAMLWWAA